LLVDVGVMVGGYPRLKKEGLEENEWVGCLPIAIPSGLGVGMIDFWLFGVGRFDDKDGAWLG
jgi:hypothetical protein